MDLSLRYTEVDRKVASSGLVLRLVKPRSELLPKSRPRYLDTIMAAEGIKAAQQVVEVARMGKEVVETVSKRKEHTQS